MAGGGLDGVRRSYDAVATEYVRRVYDELRHKPLDRALLDELAAAAGNRGLVCDLGCGPGHVAAYLRARGAAVCGVDLSPRLVEAAHRLNPGIAFSVGDMRALPVADEAFAAVVAFYSMIHFERPEMGDALSEVRRVLRPGGIVVASFHRGSQPVRLESWWGVDVDLDFHFFERGEIEAELRHAGFVVERLVERDPYEGFEVDTRRLYARARKPRAVTER